MGLCEFCIGCDRNIPEKAIISACKYFKKRVCEKPPLGAEPKWLHDEHRYSELCGAISRAYNAGSEINIEWILEYNELVDAVTKRRLVEEFKRSFEKYRRGDE